MKYFSRIILKIALILSIFAPLFAQGESKKRTVKVAYFYGEGFQDKSPIDGRRYGYGYEYLQKVAYYAGWEYEYIDTYWAEALSMLETGQADILAEVSKTPEREKKILFSELAMGMEEYYIYIQPESSTIKSYDLKTINGKAIGINAGSYQLEVFRDWCAERNLRPNIIEYEDEEQRNKDFLEGKLDAAVDYDFYLDQGWLPLLKIGKSNYYLAVTPSKPDLLEELNLAQSKLFESSPLLIERLQTAYFPHEVISKHLNMRERTWLRLYSEKNGKIKIGYIDNYLPYCAKNEETGKPSGVLAIFLEKLKETFGIEAETIPYKSREELYEAIRKDEVPAGFPVYNMLWQTEQLGIMQTEPIVDFPQAIIFQKGKFPNFEKHCKFAIAKSGPMQGSYIMDKHPTAEVVEYDTFTHAFKAISDGKADAMFLNSYILTRIYSDYADFRNLDVFYLPNDARLNMGINFSHPELLSIFNKTIVLLEKAVITSSLVHNSQMEGGYSFRVFFREHALGIVAFIILFSLAALLFMNHQIERIRYAKRQAETAKENAEELNLELESALRREKDSQEAVQQAFEAVNRANATKTQVLANLSSHISAPMNNIIEMAAQAAENKNDSEKVQNCISQISASSKNLLELINDALNINKSGGMTL